MTETPKEITADEVDAELERDQQILIAEYQKAMIEDGIRGLVMLSGENSRDHGFHEGFPDADYEGRKGFENMTPAEQRQLQLNLAEKIALIHEETSEALGEIRSGRDPLEIYYVDHKGNVGTPGLEYTEQQYRDGVPQCKPEGFLVEVADILIRAADMTFLVHGREQLVKARAIKHEYNATRPYKHGRKF